MSLAKRVRALRLEKNLTQAQLAHKVGLSSKVSISNLETGTSQTLKADGWIRLIEVLDTSHDYLMHGVGPKHPKK